MITAEDVRKIREQAATPQQNKGKVTADMVANIRKQMQPTTQQPIMQEQVPITQPVVEPTPQAVTQPVQQPIRGTTNQQTTTLPNSLNIKNNIVQQANNSMPSFKTFQTQFNEGKKEAQKEIEQKGDEFKGRDIENYDKLLKQATAEHNTKNKIKYENLKEEAEKQVKEKAKTASADDYDLDFTSQSNNINMLGNEVQRNAKLYEDMSNLGASQEELNKIASNYQTALNEYNEALNKYYDNQYYDKYKNNNMFRDIAESFGKNVLGGTATPINFGTAATSKLIGNDATTINAEQLLQYNNGKGFNGKDVERILDKIIPSPMSIINNATGRNEGPATAYAHLALLAQTHPNSRKLQNLLSAISNHSYTGTAEDLKKDLDEAQKEMYQDFKNRTTQDDLNRVAEQTAHNERAYENMAWIPNAFGTVGNMVPSMLVGGAAGGIAELAGGGSMAVAGTAANTLQRVGSLGTLGLGAGGSAMDEAIRNGATYNQAMEYGALKGATEAGTEVLGGETVNRAFGQVGESVLGKVFGKAIGKLNIKSAIGKKLAKIGTDIAGEMTEEMIAEAVEPLWRQLTYDNGAIKDYGTIDQWKNVFKAGLEAIPSTLIMQGGNVVLNKTSQLESGIIKSIQASDNLSPESKQALIQQVQEASKQMVQEINAQEQNNQIARDTEALNLQPAQNNAQTTSQNATIASKVAELNKQGFNIPQSTANTLQAIQDVRGTRIEFDSTIDGNGVYDAKNRIIYLNPTQHARAIEFTIAHELGHDIKAGNLEDYNKLQKAVLDYAGKKQGFTEGMKALDNTYRSKLGEGNYDINDEMTNDILGEVLGNQEFLDSLAQKQPNLFQKVWNWIKNVLIDNTNGRLSFEERRMLNKYEQGFRKAYQKAFSGTQQKGMQYSIQERSDGSKYVLVDTDQNIFDGIDKKDYNKIAEMYITDYLLGNTTLSKNDIAEIDKPSSRKYTHPGKYQAKFNEKMRLTPELKNVLEIAQLTKARTKADKPNAAYPYYEYYTFDFEIGGKEFTAQLNIGIDSKGNKHLYEINRIHPAVQGTIPNQSAKVYSNDTIVPQTQHNVNNQHSLSEETNDTQNRMKKLNDDLDLTWRTRDSLYDRRDELEKQYNDTINSEDYKNAFEQVKAFDNAEDAMNSDAYKKLVEAQRIKDSIKDLQDEIDIATADMRRMQEEINNLENEDRTPEKAIKQAKKIFGTTTDFKEAGYILQDGKMLDFSGRKQGNTTSGRRALDHRQINEVGYDMDEFIGLGNIRLQPEGNGFQLMVEPTDQQYKMLEKFINQANGEIYIDIYKDGKMANPDSTEYTQNTPTSKIINDIRQYFKNGKFPAKSQYSNFLYSLPSETNGFREAEPTIYTRNKESLKQLSELLGRGITELDANIGETISEVKTNLSREDKFIANYAKEHGIPIQKNKKVINFEFLHKPETKQFVKDNNLDVRKIANNPKLLDQFLDVVIGTSDNPSLEKVKNIWRDMYEHVRDTGDIPSALKRVEREMQYVRDGISEIEEDGISREQSYEIIKTKEFQDYLDNFVKDIFDKNNYTTDEVMEEAKENHGTTDDYGLGAYMTTDGELLNFNYGGYRDDHRNIEAFGMTMQDFMDYGAIRMQPESDGFEIAIEPTQEQYDRLEDYIDQFAKNSDNSDTINIDIDTAKGHIDIAKSYSKDTPTSRIINDIKTYFKTGEYPESRFIVYSKTNNTWQDFLDNTYGKWNTGTRTNFEQLPSNEELQQAERESVASEPIALYSLSEEQQNEVNDYINKLTNDTTIDDNFKDQILTRFDNLTDYKQFENIKQDVEDYKEKAYPNVAEETKKRRWTKTAQNNELVRENLEEKDLTYVPKANRNTLEYAQKQIDQLGYENATKYIANKVNLNENISARDIAMGELLIQDAIKKGDFEKAQDLIADVAIMGTDLGQAVQALSMISRLTPEGQLKYLNKVVNRINEKIDKQNIKKSEGKKVKNIKIDSELATNILKAENQTELEDAVNAALQEVADQMPVTFGEKVAEWRYLAMLANPRTHIRNISANVAMRGVYEVKNTIQRGLETLASPLLEERTRTFKKATEDVKKYAEQSAKDNAERLTGGNNKTLEARLKEMRKVFKNESIEKLRKLNSDLLSLEDNVFTQNAYKSNLEEYLTANGIKTQQDIDSNPELVQKAIQYASEEAWKTTFHQASQAATAINKLENINGISKLIVGGTIPFKKTPINIAKTGAAYSPLGLLETVSAETYKLKNGQVTANQYIDRLSQGLTGTALFGLGLFLSNMGILKGSTDDEEEYAENIGKTKAYSIRLGNKNYDISWMSPSAMPLLMGAELQKLVKGEELTVGDVAEALAGTINPLSEMSFVSSLNSTLKSYSKNGASSVDAIGAAAENAIRSYFGQFIPTAGGQINKIIDKTQRTTTASRNSKWRTGESFLRQQINKIPGASFLLEPKTDVWGNEVKRDDSAITRTFDALINPGTVTKDNTTDVDENLLSLYEETGEKGVTPSLPSSYFSKNNYKYEMSAKEYTKYKKDYGQKAYNDIKELMKTDEYKEADSAEKAKMVKDVYTDAQNYAREEYGITLDKLIDKYGEQEAAQRYLDANLRKKYDVIDEDIPLVDFYNAYTAQKEAKSDKDANGATIPLSEANNKKTAIDKATKDLTKEQLEMLYGIFNISEKVW